MLDIDLHSSTRDEEPLVNGAINGSRGEVLALGDGSELGGVGAVSGVLESGAGTIIYVSILDYGVLQTGS